MLGISGSLHRRRLRQQGDVEATGDEYGTRSCENGGSEVSGSH